jgi:hypothetical protein
VYIQIHIMCTLFVLIWNHVWILCMRLSRTVVPLCACDGSLEPTDHGGTPEEDHVAPLHVTPQRTQVHHLRHATRFTLKI